MNEEKNSHDVEEIWNELLKHFSNWKMIKPNKHWLKTGTSERLSIKRIDKLENSNAGQKFFELTNNLSDQKLEHLKGLSEINYEQVVPAARMSILANISAIVAFISITNQVMPGYIPKLVSAVFENSIESNINHALATGYILVLIMFIPTAIGVALYSYGGVSGARDLKNLVELSLLRRRKS